MSGMTGTPTMAEKRIAFRRMHDSGFFVLPNAWDAGSALRLTNAGFRAIASTSSGAARAAGEEDGEFGLNTVLDHLRTLVAVTPLPVNADFENGFADCPEDVARSVSLAVHTGVAAVSIEDWSGNLMYDNGLAVERLQAACGRRRHRSDGHARRPQRELPRAGHVGLRQHRPRRRLCECGGGLPLRSLHPRPRRRGRTGCSGRTEAGQRSRPELRCQQFLPLPRLASGDAASVAALPSAHGRHWMKRPQCSGAAKAKQSGKRTDVCAGEATDEDIILLNGSVPHSDRLPFRMPVLEKLRRSKSDRLKVGSGPFGQSSLRPPPPLAASAFAPS